jgi:hypothetical protein
VIRVYSISPTNAAERSVAGAATAAEKARNEAETEKKEEAAKPQG